MGLAPLADIRPSGTDVAADADADRDRRIRQVRVSGVILAEMFTPPDNGRAGDVTAGLPPDAVCLGCQYLADRDEYAFNFAHPSFAAVPEGEPVPRQAVVVTNRRPGV